LKFQNPIDSKMAVRGLVVVSLVWTLAAAAPLTASAELAPAAAAPAASAEPTSVASIETTLPLSAEASATASGSTATQTVAVAPVAARKKKKKHKKLTIRQTIRKVGRARGLSRREVNALLWIAKRESNFHPNSVSRSGCHGLFQLSTGMSKGHPWRDPAWNTNRAIRYMRGRYHGVLKAKAFWLSHHWY
jgi:soluble lytic murein transglycosylase-like protein